MLNKSIPKRIKTGVQRGEVVKFIFNDQIINAYQGETIATALMAEEHWVSGTSHSQLRGVYCNIGVCYSCVMTVNGISNVRICKALVTDGCRVESQNR